MSRKTRILILGGGLAGVEVARILEKLLEPKDAEIRLPKTPFRSCPFEHMVKVFRRNTLPATPRVALLLRVLRLYETQWM